MTVRDAASTRNARENIPFGAYYQRDSQPDRDRSPITGTPFARHHADLVGACSGRDRDKHAEPERARHDCKDEQGKTYGGASDTGGHHAHFA